MGFLTNEELKTEVEKLLGVTFDVDRASGASYDLALGEEVYISGDEYPKLLSDAKPYVTIPRGQFALLMTKEEVSMPNNYLGLISIRFSVKALGLINVSGFHVDPGYKGKIVFSVFNAGPNDVVLRYDTAVFMIFFYKLKHDAKPYDKRGYQHLPPDVVTSVKGTSASLSDVDKRVGHLETYTYVFLALLIAVVGGIVALLLRGGI